MMKYQKMLSKEWLNGISSISFEIKRFWNNYKMSRIQEMIYKKVEFEKQEITNEEYVNKFINSNRLEECSKLTIPNQATSKNPMYYKI